MNTDIIITFPQGNTIHTKVGITGFDLLQYFTESADDIYAIRVNNEIYPLSQPIQVSSDVAPVLAQTKEGSEMYRRTLCFMLSSVTTKLFPEARLVIGHSLGYGFYYTLEDFRPITDEDIAAMKKAMQNLIDADKVIERNVISYKEAIALFEKQNLIQTRNQLKFLARPVISVNTLDGFSDIYYAPLLQSTGKVKLFDLMAYDKGFLLQFPSTGNPDRMPPFEDSPKLFNVYRHYKEWGKMMDVTCVADLNDLVYRRKTKDYINVTETQQNKNFANVADQVKAHGEAKVVLIAGPSSSGKTTSSKKLAIQLQILGYNPHVISLDNYYVDRTKTPRDENGDYDYECLEALDVEQLNRNLVDLFAGKEVDLPNYDFREGKQYYLNKPIHMEKNDILVMEGIHGLNDKLTPLIAPEQKFKIYLSALTQLNLDDHNRISTSDNRLVRRIVRDSQFRGKSAADTIKMWPSVQRGERLHIFPFQNNADAMLNTALDYELAVLRVYAAPLLRCVTPFEPEYAEASRLLQFLNNFYTIPATYVPGQSIIREFIGGSEFKY